MNVQILANAAIGRDCVLGKDVFVDVGVTIGDRCKIQNGVSLYRGVSLEDGVLMGPHCTTTNDRDPAAITTGGRLKGEADWTLGRTLFRRGARIGAHATIVCGDPLRTIGRWALVGAGALIVDDVPDFALAIGHPARIARHVCPAGLDHPVVQRAVGLWCQKCHRALESIVGAG